jgi:nucleoside-diphosphate-sugar epimerase
MRIFLTGASGYLGSVLTQHFARLPQVEGITGIALTAPRSPLPAKVRFIQMDIRSPELAATMAGHDVVVHTAWVVFWLADMPASERDDINLNGTRNVAEAAQATGARRFIHASSMAAYDPILARGKTGVTEEFPLGKSDSPYYYWNSKAAAERILSELFSSTPARLTLLRPIYIIGPHNRGMIESYRKNAVRFLGRNPRRQFIHEADVATAFELALRTEMPGAYNLVPDDCIRLSDVWSMVGARFVPTVPLWVASQITALKWRYLRSPIHSSWIEDMLMDFTGSNAKLKSAGWKPQHGSASALSTAL